MTAMKGVRKSTRRRPAGIRIGRYELPPELTISVMLSLLYVCFILGGSYERGDIVVQIAYFALFGVIVFVFRSTQQYYTKLAYAFLVLAILPMLWYVVDYLGFALATPDLSWFLLVGLVSLVVGTGLVAALLYMDKGKLSDIYVQAGNVKEGLRAGLTTLGASVALTAAYVIFRSGATDLANLAFVLVGLVAFAACCAIAEELLFRGMLLSRLLPLAGEKSAFVIQAFAFGAYAATFLYMLNQDPLYSVATFVVCGFAGLLLAWMTVKNKSLLPAVLAHAGLYLVIALPIFAQFIV